MMKYQPKYLSKDTPKPKTNVIWLPIVTVVVLLVILCAWILVAQKSSPIQEPAKTESMLQTEKLESEQTAESTITVETKPAETEPVATEPQMIPKMRELYSQNQEIVGWITIPDTKLDYPVMFTPNDPEKYIRADFEGNFNVGGLPFVDEKCSVDPESDNLIIYGHNMKNGTMFHTLMEYEKKEFWEEHPQIIYTTLYEDRTYEIIAAFRDRVYYTYEDVFKFYQFVNAEDETHFAEAITNYKEKALYDTGVTAEYGDKLITLVTCAYHTDYGRFVVVGRAVEE